MERLRGLQGTPDRVLQDKELLQFVLPALRADFAVVETYRYTPGERLDCPLSAFGGRADGAVRFAELAGWSDQVRATSGCRCSPGIDFFLHDPAGAADPHADHRAPAGLSLESVLRAPHAVPRSRRVHHRGAVGTRYQWRDGAVSVHRESRHERYDVVVVGSGMGGLTGEPCWPRRGVGCWWWSATTGQGSGGLPAQGRHFLRLDGARALRPLAIPHPRRGHDRRAPAPPGGAGAVQLRPG